MPFHHAAVALPVCCIFLMSANVCVFPYLLFILLLVFTFCLSCLLPYLSFMEVNITMAHILGGRGVVTHLSKSTRNSPHSTLRVFTF